MERLILLNRCYLQELMYFECFQMEVFHKIMTTISYFQCGCVCIMNKELNGFKKDLPVLIPFYLS